MNSDTRLTTLIGTPIVQSFASRMQNAAYDYMGFNLVYFNTEADNEHLGDIIKGIRFIPAFVGCAVTKPNKVSIVDYLDELDPLCKKMGACNTVVKDDEGRLVGYNTDGSGFIRALKNEGQYDIEGKSIFCFGAGGAGRAICSAIAFNGASEIYVTDTITEAANSLCRDINRNFTPIANLVDSHDYSMINHCNLIINASGIGMGGYYWRNTFTRYLDPSEPVIF